MNINDFTHYWHFDGRETSLRSCKDKEVLAVILLVESLGIMKVWFLDKTEHTKTPFYNQSLPFVPYHPARTLEDLALFVEGLLHKNGNLKPSNMVSWFEFPLDARAEAEKRREDGTAQPDNCFNPDVLKHFNRSVKEAGDQQASRRMPLFKTRRVEYLYSVDTDRPVNVMVDGKMYDCVGRTDGSRKEADQKAEEGSSGKES